jgi:cytoskeletal protein RodZ
VEAALTVGEALAEARGAAGLSVDEVSERTRIRGIVIRSIERDDFDALGGDLYVRGYLRAIAGAVGIDPQPLIREFDATRSANSGGWPSEGRAAEVPTVATPVVPASAEVTVVDQQAADPAADPGPDAGPAPDPAAGDPLAEDPAAAFPAGEAMGPWVVPAEEATRSWESDEVAPAAEAPRSWEPAEVEPAAEDTRWDPFSWEDPAAEVPPAAEATRSWEEPPAEVAPAAGPPRSWEPAAEEAPAAETTRWDPFSWEDPAGERYLGPWGDDAVADWDPAPMPGVWESPAAQVTSAAVGPEPTADRAAAPRTAADRAAVARPASRPARKTRLGAPPRPGTPRPGRPSRVRGPRWVATIAFLTVVVLAIVGIAGAEIASKLHSDGKASAAAASTPAIPTPSVTAKPSVLASATPTPPVTPAPAPVQPVSVSYAEAFGPQGTGDGDNPQFAAEAITASATRPWRTNWYTTAEFGKLKHGTGLLLGLGHRVTVTAVRLQLGGHWGASVQIRAGNNLSDLPVLSTATDTGGLVTLRLSAPTRARYVLIWFTRLPPDGAGTYQASVYSATVLGRP